MGSIAARSLAGQGPALPRRVGSPAGLRPRAAPLSATLDGGALRDARTWPGTIARPGPGGGPHAAGRIRRAHRQPERPVVLPRRASQTRPRRWRPSTSAS